MEGELNVSALRDALWEIVKRHEALRTNFVTKDEQPVQVINTAPDLPMETLDLRHMPENQRKEEVRRIIDREGRYPFDISEELLMRVCLLHADENLHILLITKHHIITDGWSGGVFVGELSALYRAFSQHRPSPLPQLPIQYADFSVWQREQMSGDVLEKQLDYWKNQLRDAPDLLPLPTDFPRPPVQSFNGSHETFVIEGNLAQKLKTLGKELKTTLYMTLLTAFNILLSRYSDSRDISIGSPDANRGREKTQALIGFFVNTLVIRTQLTHDVTFRELAAQVRQTTLDAYAHRELPFERLVEALNPERNRGYTPLFQVMFILQNTPDTEFDFPGMNISFLDHADTGAKFDLTLEFQEGPEIIGGNLEYSTDLFTKETILRLTGHFKTLLESITQNPEMPVSQLPIMDNEEREKLLNRWNGPETDFPHDRTIPSLFEEQARKTPDAPVLVFNQNEINFGDLNARANQLAHHLRSEGVKPETVVGIRMERSIDMVTGLLGILKAGGAYVALDPTYPEERLQYMIADSAVKLVLTRLPDEINSFDRENPETGLESGNPAYIVYTSGSTGRPNGVIELHRGAVNRFNWMWNAYPFEEDEVCCQKTSQGFVDFFWELFGPMLKGVPVMIVPTETVKDALVFTRFLADNRITRIVLVPSLLREMLNTLEETGLNPDDTLSHLKYWSVSGETFDPHLVKQFRKTFPNCVLLNIYGSSEVSADATYYKIESEDFPAAVPIGRPYDNVTVFLLDSQMQPVPTGIPGEIYIGGPGLARGYINRPELTAARFVGLKPQISQISQILFKTGDLGKWLPDGNIEYLGRKDNQIKIRGFRVELGEIEAVLGSHPHVRECAVRMYEESPGNKMLVAYLVSDPEPETAEGNRALREFLAGELPDYMVPQFFIPLETMPLTPSGKIDRKSLEKLTLDGFRQSDEEFVAPRTSVEKAMAKIWSELLNIDKVGINDNFFQLGGHSLMATRVIARVREIFSIELSLNQLFESPTIASLSRRFSGEAQHFIKTDEIASPVVSDQEEGTGGGRESIVLGDAIPEIITPMNRNEPGVSLPLSFAQRRLWVMTQMEGENSAYNMPIALHLDGPLDRDALSRSLKEIVRRHESLRMSFPTLSGVPVVKLLDNPFRLEYLEVPGETAADRTLEVQRLVDDDARKPFNLATGPLFRARLLKLGPEAHILATNMHHIISDGWSLGVLTHELSVLYLSFLNGEPSPLPPLEIQYVDFAHWQRQWFGGGALDNQVRFWREELAGVPALLDLPTDHPRPPVRSFRGGTMPMDLSRRLSGELIELSVSSGCTLFMVLQAAFAVLLARYSGQDDIVIGSPIANRTKQQVESLIGFFVNNLVLRVDVSGNPTFSQLLKVVKESSIAAFENQDLPFEQMLEEINPERDLSFSPLFQVMMILQNAPLGSLELSGLTFRPMEHEITIAKFDLTLSMGEGGGLIGGSWEYATDLFESCHH